MRVKTILLIFILLAVSCKHSGYYMEPDSFSLESPSWLGGPSMTWNFVPETDSPSYRADYPSSPK